MKYNIYKDGVKINSIIADEQFCAAYCEENGYTYERVVRPETAPEPEKEPTTEDVLNALLGVTE